MKTILKYLVFVITIPLWLPGLILWGFLLWNSQGGNWWAFKLVFFLPKQSKTAELEKEVIELKREHSTLHNLMTTAERRGVEKAREESKNIQSDAAADAEARAESGKRWEEDCHQILSALGITATPENCDNVADRACEIINSYKAELESCRGLLSTERELRLLADEDLKHFQMFLRGEKPEVCRLHIMASAEKFKADAEARFVNMLFECKKVIQTSIDTFGHAHWDETMEHGLGCPICKKQREVRIEANATLLAIERELAAKEKQS